MLDQSSVILTPIGYDTWDSKYRWKTSDNKPLDRSVSDTWRRVARQLAEAEPHDIKGYEEKFYGLLESRKFLPAGRILSGAGTGMKTTLFNCFVMGAIDDSMEGILESHKESMLSLRMGGGVGMDFSTLRPKGAPVYGVNSVASGPLTFMDIWDTGCKTIMGAGTRRGAMMATMRCDHPDIEAFIEAKRDPNRFRNFNLSVLVTDAFMRLVHEDEWWPLQFGGKVYKNVRARDLWDKIMLNTYESAEPGVIFIDRVNHKNNLWYCEEISCSNPCGEQMLPPYGACLLGSINMVEMIKNPFTPNASISGAELEETVAQAIRMMDNVIDVSNYPLPQQKEQARSKRRIGLGVTGLADALAMAGKRYGSESAAYAAGEWMRVINEAAYAASIELAMEKGHFHLFDRDKYSEGEFVRELPDHIVSNIKRYGIRNSHLTSVAPTGTISLFAGNLSSGVEPIFAYEYTRKVLRDDGTREPLQLRDYAIDLWLKQFGGPKLEDLEAYELPNYFVTAQELTPSEHLRMLAAVQKHVDSSVSKTVNLPKEISFDEFKGVYEEAYNLGIKCCSTYRPNDITGSVLEVKERGKKSVVGVETTPTSSQFIGSNSFAPQPVFHLYQDPAPKFTSTNPDRPDRLKGETYKIKWPQSDHAMYVTINDHVVNGLREPYEIFINTKNMAHYSWVVALTRMISAIFRRGGDVRFVVEELKAVFDPQGGAWVNGGPKSRYSPSIIAEIGFTLEEHMLSTGYMSQPVTHAETLDDVPIGMGLQQCPKCGGATVVRQEGCDKCLACDYSKCG